MTYGKETGDTPSLIYLIFFVSVLMLNGLCYVILLNICLLLCTLLRSCHVKKYLSLNLKTACSVF